MLPNFFDFFQCIRFCITWIKAEPLFEYTSLPKFCSELQFYLNKSRCSEWLYQYHEKPNGKRQIGRQRKRWENNIRIVIRV